MKLNVPERFEDFHDGDMKLWLNRATEELDACAEALADNKITREQFTAIFQSFEKILLRAAKARVESTMALAAAGHHCTVPRRRYAYFARAYALEMKEYQDSPYHDVENALWAPYSLADYAHEMGRIHEADGEMQKAAEFYALSLRHIQEASDIADAGTQLRGDGLPRRPRYEASLERVRKLLK